MEAYKNDIRRVLENKEWREYLDKVKKEHGLTDKEAMIFTALNVFAYNYGEGDALGGLALIGAVRNDEVLDVIEKVLGKRIKSYVGLFIELHRTEGYKIIRKILH